MSIISCADRAKIRKSHILKDCNHWEEDGMEYPAKLIVILDSCQEHDIPPYIKGLIKDAKETRVELAFHFVPSQYEARQIIEAANKDEGIHGIMVYKSDNSSWNYLELCNFIHYMKDVDGAGLCQRGLLTTRPNDEIDRHLRIPATARAIADWVWYKVAAKTEKHTTSIAVIGRGDVGMATALALVRKGYAPTIYSSDSMPDINNVICAYDAVINTAPKKFWCNTLSTAHPTFIVDVSGTMDGNIFKGSGVEYTKDIGKLTRAMLLDNTVTSWCQLSIPLTVIKGSKVVTTVK